MTYAQELLAEGEHSDGFLRQGVEWSVIERANGGHETRFQALKQQVEDMTE